MKTKDQSTNISDNIIYRLLWTMAGLTLTFIGLVGIIIPGLPTTIFMILAAACFSRSSVKLYNWILNHKLFGKYVRNYRSGMGMPLKAKIISILLMSVFVTHAVLFGIPGDLIWAKIITLVLAIIGCYYILNQPTLKE